jgi:hypothetical protein
MMTEEEVLKKFRAVLAKAAEEGAQKVEIRIDPFCEMTGWPKGKETEETVARLLTQALNDCVKVVRDQARNN